MSPEQKAIAKKKEVVLKAIESGATIAQAAALVGYSSSSSIHEWRQVDLVFASKFRAAQSTAREQVVMPVMFKLAVEGVTKFVVSNGRCVINPEDPLTDDGRPNYLKETLYDFRAMKHLLLPTHVPDAVLAEQLERERLAVVAEANGDQNANEVDPDVIEALEAIRLAKESGIDLAALVAELRNRAGAE